MLRNIIEELVLRIVGKVIDGGIYRFRLQPLLFLHTPCDRLLNAIEAFEQGWVDAGWLAGLTTLPAEGLGQSGIEGVEVDVELLNEIGQKIGLGLDGAGVQDISSIEQVGRGLDWIDADGLEVRLIWLCSTHKTFSDSTLLGSFLKATGNLGFATDHLILKFGVET